ncbi:Ppx/GppA phosphatase family protein [Meiothermus hypogaeus]|uniref:Exopolyphosphatase n=2 Tax=Meiothermus hypogaeus TaxID=884155 RepID=A0A511R025_9DEIN|nr:Ppx/GppA phosphatase family protein [Meiothermus hypogaeus]RIH80889.1 Guanosine-5'-triphosphate,3'-diphosphate pyrophosphatase [Meiothermus hypogaeus]GEM82964.1 exopolyphosphatase [Meiothermus hypogaeus NBRC 106114]
MTPALTELEPPALRLYDGAVHRLGIVDLGSGTARLVVYVYEPGKHFRLVDEIRETVRLGEGLATQGRLSKSGMQRALSALKLYADFAQATDLDDLRVIATSASRDAENGTEFMREVRKLGLQVQVLSGEDEARYGVLAVANSFTFEDAWVMDLGGGSAQLSRMKCRQYQEGRAYPLGAVRLTELFLKSNPPKKGEIEDLERFVRKEMKAVLAQLREHPLPLVAMGGTVRNLAKLAQRRRDYPLDLVHGYYLSREALEEVVGLLAQRTTEQRRQLEGLQADRADVIVAGGLVYRTVLREGGLEGLWISGQGVREGAFYREFLSAPHLLSDVRGFYVRNLFARYPQDFGHTARVRHFCRLLFRLLGPLHGYGQAEEQLLDEAALLHDIGMSVGYYDHHKHGEYLVMSAAIPGLTHREQVLLGLLVRYHRKGEPRPGAYRSVLQEGDNKRLLRLATLLRISEYLERSRVGRVEGLEVEIGPKQVRLTLLAQEEPWVEMSETRKQAKLFQQAFGYELLVEWKQKD